MLATQNVYEYVNGLAPIKTPHNLSYQVTGTGDMGIVYPHYHQLLYPGDKVEIGAEALVRFNPQLAPLMHEIRGKIMYFAVPIRLLWEGTLKHNKFETWVTGAYNGQEIEKYNKEHPNKQLPVPDIEECRWIPWEYVEEDGTKTYKNNGTTYEAIGAEIGTVWEALGLPYREQIKDKVSTSSTTLEFEDKTNLPVDWPKRAYNKIYNDWLRNENLQEEREITADGLCRINWPRDYLTAAAYEQQKGTAPTLPLQLALTGNAPIYADMIYGSDTMQELLNVNAPTGSEARSLTATTSPGAGVGTMYANLQDAGTNIADSGVKVTDLRHLVAVQRALEMDMGGGTRYTEYTRANFNASPRDERLQLAEYIGQQEFVVNVDVVLQTGAKEGDSPQGNMSGYSVGYADKRTHRYYAEEHIMILGLFVVAPKPQYQQRIPRDLIIENKYSMYRPQFAFLSEQEIYTSEVYFTGDPDEDKKIWGFQGRHDHLRMRDNLVTGLMRADVNQNLSYYNLARMFQTVPQLNKDFVECTPRRDYLAIPSQPELLYTIGFYCHAMRPIPTQSDPGLIDHVYGDIYGAHAGSNKVSRQGRHITAQREEK